MNLGFATVGTLIVICYLAAQAAKTYGKINKWIPVLSGTVGLILGVAGFYIMPEFPAPDVMTAMAVGVSSGFAATGVHQVYKQLKGGANDGD